MSGFISIPVRSMSLNPKNRTQVARLIEMAEARFKLAAKSWIDGNNSGDPQVMAFAEKRAARLRGEGEAYLSPLSIKCTYPGLYPLFEVKGFEEHTVEAAVLLALGHARNWLRQVEDRA